MRRTWLSLLIVALPILGWAQDTKTQTSHTEPAYVPAVPQASMVTGYGGYYEGGASTAAGSAMNGMASVISARGDAALSASAAAINLTQADKQYIQNRQAATNAYFEMRATNRAARAAEAAPALSYEQLVKLAHDGVPKPLNNAQLNPVTGALNWPGPLQDESFADERKQLDELMGEHARYGGLRYSDQLTVKKIVNSMFKDLKTQISSIPQADYIAAKNFLNSLLYASTKSQLS